MVKELEMKCLLKGLSSPNLRRPVFTIESESETYLSFFFPKKKKVNLVFDVDSGFIS